MLQSNRLGDEYILKGSFMEGLQESIHHSMRYFWVQTSMELCMTCSDILCLQRTTRMFQDQERECVIAKIWEAYMIKLKPNGIGNDPWPWWTFDFARHLHITQAEQRISNNDAFVRSLKSPKFEKLGQRLCTAAYSINNVEYYRLCLVHMHFTMTCPLLKNAKRNLVINQGRCAWRTFRQKILYGLGHQSLVHGVGATSSTYHPGNLGLNCSEGTNLHIYQFISDTVTGNVVVMPHRQCKRPLL